MCVIDPVNYSKIAEDQGEYGQCPGARAPALHLRPGHTSTILKQLKTIYIEKNLLFYFIYVLDIYLALLASPAMMSTMVTNRNVIIQDLDLLK